MVEKQAEKTKEQTEEQKKAGAYKSLDELLSRANAAVGLVSEFASADAHKKLPGMKGVKRVADKAIVNLADRLSLGEKILQEKREKLERELEALKKRQAAL